MTLELGKLDVASLSDTFDSADTQETAEEKAAREAADAAGGDKGDDDSGDGKEPSDNTDDQSGADGLSQEEIEALRAKPESELTDEEKATLAELDNQELDTIDYVRKQFAIDDTFENSADGFVGLATKIKETAKQEGITEFLEASPIVKEFVEHLQAGKSIDTFKAKVTPTSFETVEVTDETAESLVKANLTAKGFSEKQIATYINAVKDENNLVEEATEAKTELIAREKAQKDAIIQAEAAALAEQEEQDKKVIAQVNQLLTTGNFDGIQIPKADLGMLKDFIFKTDAKNQTQRDVKYSNLTLSQRLLLDYIVAKDFKVTGLAPNAKPAKDGLGKVGGKNPLKGASASGGSTKEGNLNDLPVIKFGQ